MTDAIKTLTQLQSDLGDNTARSITPQKVRNIPYSALGVAPLVGKSATYTLTENDQTIVADATGGAITLNLPACSTTRVGKIYSMKKSDSGGNAVTFDAAGSDTIDGAGTLAVSTQYHAATIQNTGTTWVVLSKYTP